MTGRRVLVVDDDSSIREVARMALELVGGWEVFTAVAGPEGVARAKELLPDAILMDVMMPGMDGPTAIGHLRADDSTREIPVILLTAKAGGSDRRDFSDLQLAGVLAKPFDPMTLSADVAKLLHW